MTLQNSKAIGLTKWAALLVLAAALAIGGWLRFAGLSDQGITTWDGAFYANVARGPAMALDWLRQDGQGGAKGLLGYIRENGGEFAGMKAGHLALMAIGFLIMGVSQFTALIPLALCGWLSLLMVFWLGARFFDRGAGALAAAILSAAVLHVAYSRTAYPQTDTALLFMGTVFFYLRSLPNHQTSPTRESRSLVWCSLLGGIALTMHPSVASTLAGLGINEAFLLFCDQEPGRVKRFVKRGLLFVCLLPVPILCMEALTWALAHLGGFHLDSIFDYFVGGGGEATVSHLSFSFKRLWFFPNRFWYSEGPLFAALALVGLAYGVIGFRQGKESILRAIWLPVAVQLLVWSFAYSTTKTLTVVMPLIYLLAAVGLSRGLQFVCKEKPALAGLGLLVLAGLIMVNGAWRSIGVMQHKNGYQQATNELAAYLKTHGGTFSLWDQSFHIHPFLRFYLGEARRKLPHEEAAKIQLSVPQAGDYLFITEKWGSQKLNQDPIKKLLATERPIIKVAHLGRRFMPGFQAHSGLLSSDLTEAKPREGDNYILIFDKRLLAQPFQQVR
jgi:4-amino-4-deoxy-L-arabinose transferase-like glycosyltransferase